MLNRLQNGLMLFHGFVGYFDMINNNANGNNISIPWYRQTVNFNAKQENSIPNNVKFDINLHKPKPQQNPQQNPQENEAREPVTQDLKGKVPGPVLPPFPIPEKKPQEQPTGIPVNVAEPIEWKTAGKIGQSIWASWDTEQRANFVFNLLHGFRPNDDEKKLWAGAKYAAGYDYSSFNMGEYWNGLVLVCGVVAAITIMTIIVVVVVVPK